MNPKIFLVFSAAAAGPGLLLLVLVLLLVLGCCWCWCCCWFNHILGLFSHKKIRG